MEWGELARQLIALGAPLLGNALGGPLGSAAAKLLADALGAVAPTAAALGEALGRSAQDRAAALQAALAVQKAEAEWAAALAELGRAQVAEIGATQRAEIGSEDLLQRWWRPLYALELSLLECPAFAATLLHALWVGHEVGINGFASLSGLLMTYFAARFGVLGVYVSGRTREKQAALTGTAIPSVVDQVVKAVRRK